MSFEKGFPFPCQSMLENPGPLVHPYLRAENQSFQERYQTRQANLSLTLYPNSLRMTFPSFLGSQRWASGAPRSEQRERSGVACKPCWAATWRFWSNQSGNKRGSPSVSKLSTVKMPALAPCLRCSSLRNSSSPR